MFAPESQVTVFPYSVQQDGEEYVLGGGGGAYIALPSEGIEILRALAAGHTVAEVEEIHYRRHGERPDLASFLAELARRGFVAAAAGDEAAESGAREGGEGIADATAVGWLPRLARLLFGRWALAIYLAVVAAAVAAAVLAPDIVPSRRALLFSRHRAASGALLLVCTLFSIWLHEMGHLLAARAAGVKGRLAIGHRLWVVVAETDLSGLWSLPRRRRYLPVLAGCIVDLVSAAVLLLVLGAAARRWIVLPDPARQLMSAVVFIYFMRLLWQGYFFVRTDLYYVIGGLTGCKNLMADTEGWLRNRVARVLPGIRRIDQSAIPRRELPFIRLYAVVWVTGRLAALGVLVFVTVPVAGYYFTTLWTALRDVTVHPLAFVDSLCVTAAFLVPFLAGLLLWARGLIRPRRISS